MTVLMDSLVLMGMQASREPKDRKEHLVILDLT